jgi:chromate reductase, NAD(P)H dehydrogenase (quinone)
LLLSTSTGPRGGATVLEIAKNRFPFQGGNVVGNFALPRFNDNFEEGKGIINEDLKQDLKEIMNQVNEL